MPVAATSQIAKAAHALRRLVASSAAFQSVVGAETEAEALEHVYLGEADDTDGEIEQIRLAHPRPRAIIRTNAFSLTVTGVGDYQEQHGLELSFEFQPPQSVTGGKPGKHITDEATWFDNKWGAIVSEMVANSGQANDDDEGYFVLTSLEVAEGPMQNNPDEDPALEYFWGVAISIAGPNP